MMSFTTEGLPLEKRLNQIELDRICNLKLSNMKVGSPFSLDALTFFEFETTSKVSRGTFPSNQSRFKQSTEIHCSLQLGLDVLLVLFVCLFFVGMFVCLLGCLLGCLFLCWLVGFIGQKDSSGASTKIRIYMYTYVRHCSWVILSWLDYTPPTFSCPPSIVRQTSGGAAVTITWPTPTATDAGVSIPVRQTEGQSSGSQFGIGRHTVTYTARDTAGNTAFCSFTITVQSVSQGMSL